MAVNYTTIGWENRVVERPRTYTAEVNQDGSRTDTPAPGEVVQGGTPLNEDNLGHMDRGIADCAEQLNATMENLAEAQATIAAHDTTIQSHTSSISAIQEVDRTQNTNIQAVTTEHNLLAEDVDTLETSYTAHAANRSNPHSVTKSQVGLGNVPNVTTNNQTPTWTASSSLANISSGETATTIFGKIAKAIADLISHLGNSTIHVTEADKTAWNGKAAGTHNHAASAITSGTLGVARGGTGKSTITSGAILKGNGTSAIAEVTGTGALHATTSGSPAFGTLPVSCGGTGNTAVDTTPTADSTKMCTSGGIKTALDGKAASSHNHAASAITSGTLGVARGGTGKGTFTSGAILKGAGTSAVAEITGTGALYATTSGSPAFGTLPVSCGGTGNTAVDTTPTANSTKMCTSGGIKTALDGKAASSHNHSAANITSGTLAVARGGTGNTSVDTTPTADSTKMCTSGGIKSALDGKAALSHNHSADNITSGTLAVARGGTGNTSVDTTPTANSTKMCTSGGIKTALDGKAASSHNHSAANITSGTLAVARGGTGNTSVDTTPTAGSTKMCTSGGIKAALTALESKVDNLFKKIFKFDWDYFFEHYRLHFSANHNSDNGPVGLQTVLCDNLKSNC